jgi:hypothetical protein
MAVLSAARSAAGAVIEVAMGGWEEQKKREKKEKKRPGGTRKRRITQQSCTKKKRKGFVGGVDKFVHVDEASSFTDAIFCVFVFSCTDARLRLITNQTAPATTAINATPTAA